MNATSLYVSTCRLIMQADIGDKSSWSDLYRLLPYLRQSLSCTVCSLLLKEPHTPTESSCQHHVCKECKGGRKKLKPSCGWCKDYEKYEENVQLRILLQCYKKLCEYLVNTEVYKNLVQQEELSSSVNGGSGSNSGIVDLIQEAAGFEDNFQSTGGLSKSAYSILPCVYTNSTSTQTQVASTSSGCETRSGSKESPSSKNLSNGSSLYSVMYAGSGNKITIKRKAVEDTDTSSQGESPPIETVSTQPQNFKKPTIKTRGGSSSKRKGCRCGNATATPGKLTCCGQRCPCYVDSKPCTECKCKGCRNPHRPDGLKVRPHLVDMDAVSATAGTESSSDTLDTLDNDSMPISNVDDALEFTDTKAFDSQLQDISPSLPAAIMMDEEVDPSSPAEDELSSPHEQYETADHTTPSSHSHSSGEHYSASDLEVDV